MKKKKIIDDMSVKELEVLLKKYKSKGLKPYIKGKGSGAIKIKFE